MKYFLLVITLIFSLYSVASSKVDSGVGFVDQSPRVIDANSSASVSLDLSHIYDEGDLSVELVLSEGLTLVGGELSKTFNLADSKIFPWSLMVMAETGRYYITVYIHVKEYGRYEVVNIPVLVGNFKEQDVMLKSAQQNNNAELIIMPAEEVIIQR